MLVVLISARSSYSPRCLPEGRCTHHAFFAATQSCSPKRSLQGRLVCRYEAVMVDNPGTPRPSRSRRRSLQGRPASISTISTMLRAIYRSCPSRNLCGVCRRPPRISVPCPVGCLDAQHVINPTYVVEFSRTLARLEDEPSPRLRRQVRRTIIAILHYSASHHKRCSMTQCVLPKRSPRSTHRSSWHDHPHVYFAMFYSILIKMC